MTRQISEILEDWDVWEPQHNSETKLHIPTMWELSQQARELRGGDLRIILLDQEAYQYVLIARIGEEFALDVFVTTDEDLYCEMLDFCDSQEAAK